MSHRFEDDPAWVRFKCVELAREIDGHGNIESVIRTAEKIQSYILPKATVISIEGGKDAIKKQS